jgi:hypothetical protein
MDINDPLRVSAQGVKSDYSHKIEKYYNHNNGANGGFTLKKHKRYYPSDQKGQIDEWKAIVDTQVEDARIKKNKEDKQKKNSQNTYYEELGYLHNVKEENRNFNEYQKEEERAEIDQTMQLLNSKQRELNNEDKKFKQAMGHSYIKEMANHRKQQQEQKLRSINEDNIKLKDIEKMTQKELLDHKMQKLKLKYEKESDLKLKQDLRKEEMNQREREKYEYNQMILDNTKREQIQEQEYRKKFKFHDIENRMKNYEEFMKNNSSNRTVNWKDDDALRDKIVRRTMAKHQNETMKNFEIVKMQLERKQQERAKDAELQRKAIEQRFKDDEFNKKLDRLEKEENKKNQILYQDMLSKQIQLKTGNNLGTMTHSEK